MPPRNRTVWSENPDISQRDRFIETAVALQCDEDGASFKVKLALIAGQKAVAQQKEKK